MRDAEELLQELKALLSVQAGASRDAAELRRIWLEPEATQQIPNN
ncbi:MAG TPA: hypothetical protein VEZ24_12410 [Microvirga sp.]|nr:hypothetical protein [Microvirga sp.]